MGLCLRNLMLIDSQTLKNSMATYLKIYNA